MQQSTSTCVRRCLANAPKPQPRWLAAAYGAFVNKEGTNYQIQIGVLFRYERCPELRRADSIDLIAEAWLACEPLVNLGVGAGR
jgi:hypothetical protein